MDSHADRVSEGGDTEDLPSDFFDDFSKEDFIESLSVVDSWCDDDNKKRSSRITETELQNVKDLRELIGDDDRDRKNKGSNSKYNDRSKRKDNQSLPKKIKPFQRDSRLDEFIKPGSRRDPSKTSEAIRKDKEVKVKEYLDKVLEGTDDIRPPGTELDDYFNENKTEEKRKTSAVEGFFTSKKEPIWESKTRRHSPHWSPKRQQSPRISLQRSQRRSPWRSPRRSPPRASRRSPRRSPHYSSRWNSRIHHSSYNSKFRRYSPAQRSPHRISPSSRSPQRRRYSKSPVRHKYNRSYSRSPIRRESPLYTPEPYTYYPTANSQYTADPHYPAPVQSDDYAGGMQMYQQAPFYPADYSGTSYDYGVQQVLPAVQPQPVPAPLNIGSVNPVAPPLNPVAPILSEMSPAMVPPPSQPVSTSVVNDAPDQSMVTPYDALAQLVAEGKLSKEDYLKLAPNKGVASSTMDCTERVKVLKRCNDALSKLSTLCLPSRLLIEQHDTPEIKSLPPKFCSPLKRIPPVEFHFTKASGSTTAQQNRQLVNSIIATIGLDKLVGSKKKPRSNMIDAAVQTTKVHCDLCEIRESTQFNEVGTSTDPGHFSESVHTQVVEQDLISSKAVFNVRGSVSDGAPISISHLTPAQLVSQLAARAKTLKQTSDPMPSSSQFTRRNPSNSYDYSDRGGQHYYNNNKYRY
ncbi:uncharacterized protein LOC131842146 [Achroia grisella]|uniref:uncharacterized protein LOC131842146 n=1 Tax=Achroia grisella TaxID=688607 RepID=UPI0027D25B23|nr:uncharacterized protein LOC131842146 [Achroia grisella]